MYIKNEDMALSKEAYATREFETNKKIVTLTTHISLLKLEN